MTFRRHYAIDHEKVEDVSSLKDVDDVDAALKQMISEGANVSATIQRQNENIKIGSELMIHAVYDSLLDLSLQLIIKTYPGGLEGLIDSASHAYTSFPPGMEALVNQVRDGLHSYVLSNMHESSLNEAVEMTTKLFSLVEKGHSELGILFNDHHETLNEKVQEMHSLLKRAEKGNKYLDTSSENERSNITSDTKAMDSEKAELETLKKEISSLAQETEDFRIKRTGLEQPQNFGEGFAWGFFGIGAAVAAGKRASLSKSIASNESKLNEEKALQKTHQTRYNEAFGRVEKAKLILINLTSHQTDINKHIQRLKDVQASSTEALRFVVERKNTITRIHNDLVNMARFSTRYATHRYDEEASAKFLAEGIVNVLDATPDWPGTATPVILTAILLRWPPSLVTTSDIDVLGEERGGESDIEVEFDRVVENAYKNYRQFAEVASPVPRPRLDDYLRDVEFDWEKTIASWHNMIADAQDTRIRPAPVVEQYWNE
ncbi:hypothetical protein ZTR_04404 [Talaromyces verruculosus]|nr:hypothetical protein ZTR_04404 [Talaromyces verruculosus]